MSDDICKCNWDYVFDSISYDSTSNKCMGTLRAGVCNVEVSYTYGINPNSVNFVDTLSCTHMGHYGGGGNSLTMILWSYKPLVGLCFSFSFFFFCDVW